MRPVPVRPHALAVAVLTALAACTDTPTSVPTAPAPSEVGSARAPATRTLGDWLRRNGGASNQSMLVGAGDIAECITSNFPRTADPVNSGAAQTAALLGKIPGRVITIGDNAYPFGSILDFMDCYDPTWGAHKERTYPALGNHEYMSGGSGHFTYFWVEPPPVPAAPNPAGYYSYNVGSWHVVVLNSTPQVYLCRPPETTESWPPSGTPENPVVLPEPPEMTTTQGRLCAGDLAQQAWLVQDLASHRQYECTVVYFHHPRFSSGPHGNHAQMQRMWDIMWLFGVDVALTAHDHHYERFAPQDLNGRRDRDHGIRQFVIGTGGAHLRDVTDRVRNSQVIIDDTWGVLALALQDGRYSWAFVDVNETVRDSGRGECHGQPRRRRS